MIVHFDCSSGAAGDMLLGALLDAGASEERVREALDALNLEGWTMEITETTRRGLRAKRVEVKVEAEPARSYPEVRAILEGSALTPALIRAACSRCSRGSQSLRPPCTERASSRSTSMR